jgi:hypothetical protein
MRDRSDQRGDVADLSGDGSDVRFFVLFQVTSFFLWGNVLEGRALARLPGPTSLPAATPNPTDRSADRNGRLSVCLVRAPSSGRGPLALTVQPGRRRRRHSEATLVPGSRGCRWEVQTEHSGSVQLVGPVPGSTSDGQVAAEDLGQGPVAQQSGRPGGPLFACAMPLRALHRRRHAPPLMRRPFRNSPSPLPRNTPKPPGRSEKQSTPENIIRKPGVQPKTTPTKTHSPRQEPKKPRSKNHQPPTSRKLPKGDGTLWPPAGRQHTPKPPWRTLPIVLTQSCL